MMKKTDRPEISS